MDYDIGKLVYFEGIVDGIENTNFKTFIHKYDITINI